MPHPLIQPLPLDLRNQSFEGLDCEGWDFSGRDIRGCDFRSTKLKEANFSRAIAGRSRKQSVIIVAVAVAVAVTFAGAATVAVTVAFAFTVAFAGALKFAVAVAGIATGVVAAAFACAVAFTDAFTGAGISAGAVAGTSAGAVAGIVLNAIQAFSQGKTFSGIFWSILAVILLAVALYLARGAVRELKKATGTNFKGADLQDVDFSHALLNNCNFEDADTRYVNWSYATGDRFIPNFTSTRLQLLISRSGTNAMYVDMDLSDRHLAGIELIKANLQGADLTRSNLQHADLTLANLTNAKAGGTDFRYATFTGACIQNWTINGDTQFDDLICDFIYLTPDRNPQNRRPLSGSFEPGDFEKLVEKFADTLDFILRQGTDPIAFRQALSQFKQDNPEALIKAMVELDGDRVLVQATLPEGADKVKAYEAFQDNQAKLQFAQQEIRHLERTVEDKDKTISMMDRLLYASQQRPITNILQQAKTIGDVMPDKSNEYKSGGDINIAKGKSAINTGTGVAAGGDIRGTLTLNLAALKETEDPKAKELVELISQLRQAIEAPDCDLEDRFKQRALEYLDNLTKLAKDQPDDRLKQAKDNLDDLTDIAEKGSKLANFAKEYFPAMTAAIAGIRLWFGI